MKKIVKATLGGAVLTAGIAMIVLPGPALLMIPAGLAILATEFHWARRALDSMKRFARRARRNGFRAAFLKRKRRPVGSQF